MRSSSGGLWHAQRLGARTLAGSCLSLRPPGYAGAMTRASLTTNVRAFATQHLRYRNGLHSNLQWTASAGGVTRRTAIVRTFPAHSSRDVVASYATVPPNDPPKPSVRERISTFMTGMKEGFTKFKENNTNARAAQRKQKEQGDEALNRAEVRLIQNHAKDVFALFPFGFFALVLPEAIPFILLWFPSMVPSTFRPMFISEKSKRKQVEQQNLAMEQMAHLLASSPPNKASFAVFYNYLKSMEQPSNNNNYSSELLQWKEEALSSDRLVATCKFMTIPTRMRPEWYLRRSLSKALTNLIADDQLIQKDGGIRSLKAVDLKEACEERKLIIYNQDTTVKQQQKYLEKWLELSQKTKHNDLPRPVILLWSMACCRMSSELISGGGSGGKSPKL
ncbi:hypothetical protein QOT17_001826 [Balamuthia mandrillaris]